MKLILETFGETFARGHGKLDMTLSSGRRVTFIVNGELHVYIGKPELDAQEQYQRPSAKA